MPFRRGRPLHERLAEEGGLDLDREARRTPRAPWDDAGIHGVARPREWDAVIAVDAAGPDGVELAFVTLPGGDVLLESDEPIPDDEVEAFAGAVEGAVRPPFRAIGIRKGPRQWALGVRTIETIELERDPGGDDVELSVHGGTRSLVVDGERAFGSLGELEELLGGRDGVVRALRLDGLLFEVTAAPL